MLQADDRRVADHELLRWQNPKLLRRTTGYSAASAGHGPNLAIKHFTHKARIPLRFRRGQVDGTNAHRTIDMRLILGFPERILGTVLAHKERHLGHLR